MGFIGTKSIPQIVSTPKMKLPRRIYVPAIPLFDSFSDQN